MKAIGRVYLIFFLKLGLVFWLFSFCRLLFYLFNTSSFPNPQAINFLGGIRFDWMTITILFLPYIFLYGVLKNKSSKVLSVLFQVFSALAIIFNFIDFEYFKFTSKRTTADLFSTSGLEKDMGNLLPTFLKGYWYIVLLAILTFLVVRWIYKKINQLDNPSLNWKQHLFFFTTLFIVTFIGFRGGVQYKPLNVLQASQYAKAENIPLVLNTPFTIIKSSYKDGIEIKNYYTKKELEKIYTPVQFIDGDSVHQKLNVVLIIGESFSKEYIGALNDFNGYTPFLDELIKGGLVFPNAFANGKKSIEGLPAILSGIPTLMNTSYISSKYASNNIQSLPSELKKNGYSTNFYHGGENGTMGFNAFTQLAGVDNYIGRNEFPYKGSYDGNWGIFDEPFLQFCIEDMSKKKRPFFSGIFTLSSHHPYTIPEEHKGKFKEGPLPILKSISYADYSLMRFFESAKKTDWFQNTLFIITADHTQQSYHSSYNNSVGMYRVPLIFYAPGFISPGVNNSIVQQNDIFSSVIDFIGLESQLLNFGQSVFDDKTPRFAINYLNGIYQFFSDEYVLQFDGEQSLALYHINEDPELKNNLIKQQQEIKIKLEKQLKAVIQQYQQRLVNNQMIP